MADLLGWIGCMCFALCGIPQAWKSFREGNASGMTLSFLLLWFGGEVFLIGASMLRFGWVGWIMYHCIVNVLCLFVILYYRIWPRERYTYKLLNSNEIGCLYFVRKEEKL